MKTIGMAAFLIVSAQWAFASDFNLPTLKYDQRQPGSLPSAPASGQRPQQSLFELPSVPKQQAEAQGISRDGVVTPPSGKDYKLRVLKAPKIDQGMVQSPDSKR